MKRRGARARCLLRATCSLSRRLATQRTRRGQFDRELLDRLVVDRRAALGRVDQRLQAVGRLEEKIGNLGRYHFLSVAKQVKQGFHLVSELRDGGESEHTACPFNGMRRPENFV